MIYSENCSGKTMFVRSIIFGLYDMFMIKKTIMKDENLKVILHFKNEPIKIPKYITFIYSNTLLSDFDGNLFIDNGGKYIYNFIDENKNDKYEIKDIVKNIEIELTELINFANVKLTIQDNCVKIKCNKLPIENSSNTLKILINAIIVVSMRKYFIIQFNFMIIDDVFNSLDKSNLNIVNNILKKIKQTTDFCFVLTAVDRVYNALDRDLLMTIKNGIIQ